MHGEKWNKSRQSYEENRKPSEYAKRQSEQDKEKNSNNTKGMWSAPRFHRVCDSALPF